MLPFLPVYVLLAANGAGYQVELPAPLAAHLQRDEADAVGPGEGE